MGENAAARILAPIRPAEALSVRDAGGGSVDDPPRLAVFAAKPVKFGSRLYAYLRDRAGDIWLAKVAVPGDPLLEREYEALSKLATALKSRMAGTIPAKVAFEAPILVQELQQLYAGRAGELVARLGLESRIDHVPAQLSTGERQRTALTRVVLQGAPPADWPISVSKRFAMTRNSLMASWLNLARAMPRVGSVKSTPSIMIVDWLALPAAPITGWLPMKRLPPRSRCTPGAR